MKFALVNGEKKHANQAKSGEFGKDLWYVAKEDYINANGNEKFLTVFKDL